MFSPTEIISPATPAQLVQTGAEGNRLGITHVIPARLDAAVAVAAALNVVEPMMSGVGGYGAIVVYDAERGDTRVLHADSRMPATLDPAVFRPPTPDYAENRRGAKAISTPGNVNAWERLSEDYGDLEWRRLFDPAMLPIPFEAAP